MNTRNEHRPVWILRPLQVLALASIFFLMPGTLGGCHVHEHRVGMGSNGLGTEVMHQYYWLFGMRQVNEVNVQRVVADYTSYEIRTAFEFTDFLVSLFLLPITMTRETVTVKY